MKRPEQELQRAVIAHLKARGVPRLFFWHHPAGGFRRPIEAAIFKGLGVVAGIPDILILHGGTLFALELKADTGRLSEKQIAVQDEMRIAGAVVATAVGLDAALAQLEAWRLLRGTAGSAAA